MTTNNKILTVSYGTFSCTLEGFEDNFGTMKAIAEYFRDLAADDRYFGAEPPQPDTEMLARIAEREISRRVQAREHDGRIVLSASDATAPEAVAGVAPAVAQATVVAAQTEQPVSAHLTSDADAAGADQDEARANDAVTAQAAAQADTAHTESAPDQTDVAADTEAAPVAAPQQDAPVTAEAVAEADSTDDTTTEAATVQEDATDVAPTENGDAATEETQIAETDPETAEFFGDSDDTIEADAEAEVDTKDDVAEAVAPASAPAPTDSIAAKLQRIRAVVSQGQQSVDADELFEDEHAEDIVTKTATDVPAAPIEDELAEQSEETEAHTETPQKVEAEDEENGSAPQDVIDAAARDIEEALDIDDAEHAQAQDPAQEDDELSALMARVDTAANAAQSEDLSEPAEPLGERDTSAGEDDLGPDTLAALMAADQGDDDTSGSGENLFESAEETETEADDAAQNDASTEQDRPRVRVIKVKRADIDAAVASGALEEVEQENAEASSTLSEDEEAELLAELAQVEAEFPTAQDTLQDADTADTPVGAAPEDVVEDDSAQDAPAPVTEPAVPAETKAPNLQDQDVSRLMAEAENQMEEPESSKRRNAFAHLKAAVKAKKADADIGSDSIKDEGAFRSDLAQVVKPRRPEVGTSRAERPETARPAPLKLVAEQRVDVDSTPKGPVRPRRVAAAPDMASDAQGAESFEDYVNELGAHDLPALLEAAASYLSFVEGRDEFSRPQLMTKVRQVEKEDFSREDGLRSFGQLLRAGKIEKVSGGRFAVTNDIGYRPEQRAAG